MVSPIGKIIRKLAEDEGISLFELATRLGIYPMTIYGIVYGTKVSRPAILKIAEYFHRPDLLFEYEKYLQQRKVESNKKGSTKKPKRRYKA